MGETTVLHRADDVLRGWFGEQRRTATGSADDRLRRAEEDLRACLDRLAPLLLSPQELALVALERQFDPEHAAAKVAGADAVLLMLPVFLDDPHWHGVDLLDRRLRIELARDLSEQIVRLPAPEGVDLGRAAFVVESAIRHEIWMLRQERGATRSRSRTEPAVRRPSAS